MLYLINFRHPERVIVAHAIVEHKGCVLWILHSADLIQSNSTGSEVVIVGT